MNLKTKTNRNRGEIAHTHQFEKGKLSSGYRISKHCDFFNDVVNLWEHLNIPLIILQRYLY